MRDAQAAGVELGRIRWTAAVWMYIPGQTNYLPFGAAAPIFPRPTFHHPPPIKIARVQGSKLRLVHIVNELLDYTYSPGLDAGTFIESLIKAGRSVPDAAETAAKREGAEAESMLLESIGGAAGDLIVMGTHGRRGLARRALGSDTEHVVRAPLCRCWFAAHRRAKKSLW